MRTTPDEGRKRIDLSVPQVAGSALAAVVAAKLASYFGVYGTILGAGIVSIVATCGGTLFQHFFKRTGQQLRDATVTARPREEAPPAPGEFGEGTVYRARVRSWRRPVVAAAVVFGVTMAGITTYELVSGSSFSGGTGTTVSDAVSRHGSSSSSSSSSDSPSKSDGRPTPSGTPSRGHAPDAGGGTTHGASPTPAGSPSEEPSGGPSPSPTPTPSTSAATPTPPEPSASSRSGTAVPDQGGPSAQ